jgi:hypothetical protein
VITLDYCESCGKELDPIQPAKSLDDNFANDTRKSLSICSDCFKKRFKVKCKKRSGYGGTIYELEERAPPRFGLGSTSYSCLKCNWVAWTDLGLEVHMRNKHQT